MEPKEETNVLLITTEAFNSMHINFLKIPSMCWEIADFCEHEQGGGHSSFCPVCLCVCLVKNFNFGHILN